MTNPEPTLPLGRKPTMADVAARAGVSRALVSTVFRGVPGASASTRERVLQASADLGYQLDNRARMLRRARTKLLGVMFRVQDAFHADLVEALYREASSSGYDLVLSATTATRPEADAVESLLNDRCEGLVLVAPQAPEEQLASLAERAPTLLVGRRVKQAGLDVVRTADAEVVRTALTHLTRLGHRDVAHVDGGAIHGTVDRRRSYRTTMRQLGLDRYVRVVRGGVSEAEGVEAARQLLGEPALPTAVVCFNDRSAMGLMFALRRAGLRVPEDISVIGYDDIKMAALPFIDLTTVAQDVEATARASVKCLIERLDANRSPGKEDLVEPYLVERATTAPAPAVRERSA